MSQLLTCTPCCCKALHLAHWRWNARVVSQKNGQNKSKIEGKDMKRWCLEKLNYRSKKKSFLFSQGGVKLSDPLSIQDHVSTILYSTFIKFLVENATKSYKIQLSTKESAGSLCKSLEPLNHIKSLLVVITIILRSCRNYT